MPFSFLTPVNMSGLEVRDVRAETVGALPGMPDATQAGRYVYHGAQLKYSDGTSWITLGAAGAGGPPSGTAGGDLTGSYPNPTIAANIIVDADVNSAANIATSKIAGLDTALTGKASTATDLTAGAGLTGGGTLAANRTFAVGAGTGITVNADDVAVNSAVLPLSGFAVPTVDVPFNSKKITGLADPAAAQDAATKNYVDNLSAGLSWKDSVRAATTANITRSAPQTIDGVAVIANERVLVKNQTATPENGIYTVAAGAWVRATDADIGTELEGAAVFVTEGTTQADTAWVLTTNAPITLNVTGLAFSQFGAGTAIVAGGGLTLTTNTIDVGAGSGITVAADSVAIDSAVVEVVSRKGAVNGYAPLDASSKVPVANLPTLGKQFAGNVGAGTAVVVNHALATRDVNVQVYRNSTPWDTVLCDCERTDTNNVTLRFAVAVAANAYRCVVTGV